MSIDSEPKTQPGTDAPNTHQLAAELGVDGQLLARFVRDHPDPTAPIVIGWAHSRGELRIHPEKLRPDVEAWLDDRPDRPEFETDLEEALRADSLRAIRGGDD
jgi:hypothetical protein